MTTKDKIARRKLSLLELASEMSNVSKACRIMGYSRQQFYEIRRNYQTCGADGLNNRQRDTGSVALRHDPALLVIRPEPAHSSRHRNPLR